MPTLRSLNWNRQSSVTCNVFCLNLESDSDLERVMETNWGCPRVHRKFIFFENIFTYRRLENSTFCASMANSVSVPKRVCRLKGVYFLGDA